MCRGKKEEENTPALKIASIHQLDHSIPIVIDELKTIPKGLVKGLEDLEIRGQVVSIQTTALLRSSKILRRVLETRVDLLSLKLQ